METFTKLFGSLLLFVYHCFDRIVVNGYLNNLSRPEQVVYFFHQVLGIPVVSKEVLSQRTNDYRSWGGGIRPKPRPPDRVGRQGREQKRLRPARYAPEKKSAYGVYFIFKRARQVFCVNDHAITTHPW